MRFTTIKERSRNSISLTRTPFEYGLWVSYWMFVACIGVVLDHIDQEWIIGVLVLFPIITAIRDYIRDFLVDFKIVRWIIGGEWVRIKYDITYFYSASSGTHHIWEKIIDGKIIHTIDKDRDNTKFEIIPSDYKIKRSDYYILMRTVYTGLILIYLVGSILMYFNIGR